MLVSAGSITHAQYGLQFNGSNQYVTFGAATSTLGVTNFTLEAWVKRASGGVVMSTGSLGFDNSGGRPNIYPVLTKGMGEGESPANINMNFFLGITSTGYVGADFEDNNGGVNHPVWGVTTVPIGEWHHIAATYDGQTWKLYLDGVLDKTLTLSSAFTPEATSIQHAALGAAQNSTGGLGTGFFSGVIDEARVWGVVRTQQEIADNMALEVISGTALKGRWGLNEGTGSTAVNSVSGSPDGTLRNSPTWTTPGAPIFGKPLATTATAITTTSFSANWNAVTSAISYRLDVATDAAFTSILSSYNDFTVPSGTTQTVSGLTAGTTYYYRVRAVGAPGTSGNSNTITATTIGPPPNAPSGLTATATIGTQINLAWTDNSSDELTFKIERSTDGGIGFNTLATVGAGVQAYFDEGLAAGMTYTYRVCATNGGGNSDWSNSASATTPASPKNALQLGSSNAYVTFGAAPALATQNFTVEVWFKRTGTGVPNTTGTGGIDIIPLITKGSPEGDGSNVDANYILGINSASNVLAADFEEGTGSASAGLNHPLSGSTIITNNVWHHAALTFAPNGDYKLYLDGNLEGSLGLGSLVWPQGQSIQHAALGAMVRSNGTANGFFAGILDEARIWSYARTQSEIQSTMNSEVLSASGLIGRWGLNEVSGNVVHATAGSIDGTVIGSGSNWTTGVPLSTPPAAPTATAATSITTTAFSANWNLVSGATSYRLDVSTANDFNTFVSGYNDLPVAGTTQSVTGLSPAVPYYYRVRAVGSEGTSGNSNTITVTTLGLPPNDPSGLTATALTYRTVQLNWTDNSSNEQHFEVDRSTDGGTSFGLIATLGANVNSYIDATVGSALQYCYRVRATNAGGNSGYTSTECATTPSEPNRALNLGASNAYVTFGTAPGLATQNFTVEVWFKKTGSGVPNTTGTGGINIIPVLTKGSPQAEGSTVDANYILGINSDLNVLAADFEEGTGSTSPGLNHPLSGTTNIMDNVWYHAAVTFASNGDYILYLNGNVENSANLGSRYPQGASIQHAAVGTMIESGGATHGYFAGIVDEARIWNTPHTQAEIQASMNAQITIPQTGLLGRYGFGEGSGDSVYCGAGGTINGSISGSGASWTTDSPFNAAPTASAVNITGTPQVGQQLTGHYTYADAEGDLEGTSTFRWLADDVAIGGAVASTYVLTSNELGKSIRFEVTPVAQTGASPGIAVQSDAVGPVTQANPTITASAGSHGSITPSGAVSVANGTDQSFIMTADPGYHLGGLVVDGDPVNPVSPYPFTNVTTNHTITASFAQNDYPVAAIGLFNIDLNGDGSTDMRINFTKLPSGGGNVSPMLFLIPPAGAPVPPSGALPYYLTLTSTIPDHAFMATVSMDMAGVTDFDSDCSLAYYNEVTSSWILVPGTYAASDAAFGGHPSFTFQTDHFTSFIFNESGAGQKQVFVSADPAVAAPGVVYPNTSWGTTTSYEPNDWTWTGTQTVSVYIVPETGLQFGACDVTLEWDADIVSYASVEFGSAGSPNGMFGSGQSYPLSTQTDRLGTQNRLRINCTTLDGTNLVGAAGAYIARVDFAVLKPGHTPIALIGTDFRSFVEGGPMTVTSVVPRQGEVRAYLGDVASSGSEATGDGVINFDDLSPWSLSYFSGTAIYGGNMDNYMAKYDIGPTSNGYVFSLPTPDAKIDFEDLSIFSIVYGLNAKSQLPKATAPSNEPVEIFLSQPVAAGAETRIPVALAGAISDLRSVHLELTGQFESFLGADKGTLTESYSSPVMVFAKANGRNVQVDCAVMGLDASAISRPGELLVLRFAGNPRVHLAASVGRTSANSPANIVPKAGAGDYQPVQYSLSQNYPNPFNPSTTIEYEVPTAGQVKIEIFNLLGEKVATIVDEQREPGFYTVQWNGHDHNGHLLGSGVYLYRLKSASFTNVKKMVLLK
jgi:hypothetical protein